VGGLTVEQLAQEVSIFTGKALDAKKLENYGFNKFNPKVGRRSASNLHAWCLLWSS
jgi:hypothetical protein